jgi:hypothetical protein
VTLQSLRSRKVQRTHRLAVTVSAFAAAVGSIALAPSSSADDAAPLNGGEPAASQPVIIDVPMPTVAAPGREGMNGIVEIRVGRSAPFKVMVDTGSVGLRVFPGAWGTRPAGVQVTSQKITSSTSRGSLKGALGKATMTIGGVSTTRPIGFQYVNSTAPVVRGWAAKRVYGILGIGTGRYQLSNPISALPGEVGTQWSVHLGGEPRTRTPGLGHLILGAEDPTDAVASFQLPPLGPDGYGALLWNDHAAPGCWTFGRTREHCVDTWFDSGFHPVRVKGAVFSRVPTNGAGQVRPGTSVGLADAGSAFTSWEFRAGRTASVNQVRLAKKGRAGINTGNAPYFTYVITYDTVRGLISLSPARR